MMTPVPPEFVEPGVAPATMLVFFAIGVAALVRPFRPASDEASSMVKSFARSGASIRMMAADSEPSVTRDALVDAVAKKAGVSKKTATDVVNATLDVIVDSVADGKKVSFLGWGSFKPRDKPERMARNPKSGEMIKVAAKTVPVFTFGSKFKEAVKNGAAK
jgi:DNA-binding protein HU-beta